jgi:hypothetical protein
MQPAAEKPTHLKRVLFAMIALCTFMGFATFMNVLGDPRSQNIRSLDIFRLIAVGANWGVAICGIAMLIRSKFRKN